VLRKRGLKKTLEDSAVQCYRGNEEVCYKTAQECEKIETTLRNIIGQEDYAKSNHFFEKACSKGNFAGCEKAASGHMLNLFRKLPEALQEAERFYGICCPKDQLPRHECLSLNYAIQLRKANKDLEW